MTTTNNTNTNITNPNETSGEKMKLAEVLLIRADMYKKLSSLKSRIEKNILVQDSDEPDEDPSELMKEAQLVNDQLHELVSRIQKTNAIAKLNNLSDSPTMLQALIERDTLIERHKIITSALNTARQVNDRYSPREIKWVVTIPVKNLQKQADDLSMKIRKINLKIQSANWQIDVLD